MYTSNTTPSVDDEDAELAAEVHEYLHIITNMQKEAKERQREIAALREQAAAARGEVEKWHMERSAAAARLAHTGANVLLLQVELQTLCHQQQEAELAVLRLRKQKTQWEAILPSCIPSNIKHNSPDSSLDNRKDDLSCFSLDCVSVKMPPPVVWALRLWRQLPQSERYLQELNAVVAELFTQLQEDVKITPSCSSMGCFLQLLPGLNDTERALLSLLTFPFSEKKDAQTKLH
ncbi:hypothetical protein LSM04_008863 [Trypanosoma melophagium]|uniref:uncharacterized protein n=1 Tax=Trypanosoma melophagium TaxID=715481 RepID=UPI00351A2DCE|nr:hypothetical protein LSM04_008863 [Trypanosoma melophagium]